MINLNRCKLNPSSKRYLGSNVDDNEPSAKNDLGQYFEDFLNFFPDSDINNESNISKLHVFI